MLKQIIIDFCDFLHKWWIFILYIMIGIVGKFSYDLVTNKKISWISAIGSIGIAGVTGYFACLWCINNDISKAPYLVPMATLLSDKFFNWVFQLDWKGIFELITETKQK